MESVDTELPVLIVYLYIIFRFTFYSLVHLFASYFLWLSFACSFLRICFHKYVSAHHQKLRRWRCSVNQLEYTPRIVHGFRPLLLFGTGAISRLLQCQWSNPGGYGYINHMNHDKPVISTQQNKVFFRENGFEDVVWNVSAILFKPRCGLTIVGQGRQ